MKSEYTLSNAVVLLVCLMLIAIIGVRSVSQHRVTARGQSCANNLKQLGLACHNYESVYKRLPPACGGTTNNATPETGNSGRLGGLVSLLPFVEQQPLWEIIANRYVSPKNDAKFPPMGPVPWYDETVYEPWANGPSVYRCPEAAGGNDQNAAAPRVVKTLKPLTGPAGLLVNYVGCFGDGTHLQGQVFDEEMRRDRRPMMRAKAANRGAFSTVQQMRFRDILDGLSNTAFFSEAVASVKPVVGQTAIIKDVEELSFSPAACLDAAKAQRPAVWPFGRGSRWCDGALVISGFQTVLPPNSPSCTSELGMDDAIVSASSRHPGGVHLLMLDGAVRFVSEDIDTGDLAAPGVSNEEGYSDPGSRSPYGVWGAVGTRASRDVVDEFHTALASKPVGTSGRVSRQRGGEDYRTWRDHRGTTSLQAKMIEIVDKKIVRLKAEDGTIHEVPLNTLRASDIFWAVQRDVMQRNQ